MDWLTLSGGVPSLSLIPLGIFHNNKYYISDDCSLHLEEIIAKLNSENQTTRPLRCALGFMDILNKDLIPILINSKDQPSVFCSTIKLLVGLTVPVECLVCVDTSNQSPTSQHIVHELTQLLYNAKEAFLDPRATRAVIDHLQRLVEKQQPLSSDDSESVNHCLLLIRNILHAPERPPNMVEVVDNGTTASAAQPGTSNSQTPYLGPHSHSHGYTADCSQQNRLLWNLFSQGLDRLLINLLACSQKLSGNPEDDDELKALRRLSERYAEQLVKDYLSPNCLGRYEDESFRQGDLRRSLQYEFEKDQDVGSYLFI